MLLYDGCYSLTFLYLCVLLILGHNYLFVYINHIVMNTFYNQFKWEYTLQIMEYYNIFEENKVL